MAGKSFWMHEDDFARTQVLPMGCWNYCCEQLDNIHDHAEAHRDPDGIGWTKMYSIPESPQSLSDLAISRDVLRAALPWSLRRSMDVLSGGWSGEGEPIERYAAHKVGNNAIVADWDEAGIVSDLWFIGGGVTPGHARTLTKVFLKIGGLSSLLLVDWRGALVSLSDPRGVFNYFEAT